MRKILSLLALVLATAGLLRPAIAGDAVLNDAAKGRKIYTSKCARCHKLYDPQKYSDAEWSKWMEKMSRKSKLNVDQTETLSRYLNTLRSGAKTNIIDAVSSRKK